MFESNDGSSKMPDAIKQIMEAMGANDEVIKAQINDQRLLKIAEYDITQGYLKKNADPDQYHAKFFELKSLVKRGSFTIKDLETDVYTRWGVLEDARETTPKSTRNTIGFCVDSMEVAQIPEKSIDNK